MIGKVSPRELEKYVFSRTGRGRDSVLVGPAYGEDTAAIKIGEQILVINSDPIIFAADQIGTLGINIASNDVAASGADPQWVTTIYLLPANDGDKLDRITKQVNQISDNLGIAVIGGHSEFVPILDRPFLGLTCFGVTDKFIPTGGAKPNDAIILTKGAGIEGTGIIATDFYSEVKKVASKKILEEGKKKLEKLSVIPESVILRKYANSMHDPTEGGIVDGLLELAVASNIKLDIQRNKIITSEDTKELCAAMNVDPLKIFGSGALLASVQQEYTARALDELAEAGVPASVIGYAKEADEPILKIDRKVYKEPIRDQLYDLWD